MISKTKDNMAQRGLLNSYVCSSMYPHQPPCWGLGGYMSKMSAPTPQPPPELKNFSKIFYTKYFFIIIKYWKCLFNSIIFKSNFINGEIQWRKAKETERGRQEETRWREEDGGWKGWKNGDDVKDGNEEDLERSNISGSVLCE